MARVGFSLSEMSIEMLPFDRSLTKSHAADFAQLRFGKIEAALFSAVPFPDLGACNVSPPTDPMFISRLPSSISVKLDLTFQLGTECVFFRMDVCDFE